MNFIDFNRETIEEKLDQLSETDRPVFGKMTPQQMVEHLEDVVNISNGTRDMPLINSEEKIPQWQEFLKSDQPIQPGFKAAFVDEDPEIRYHDLETAKKNLVAAVDKMFALFSREPDLIKTHPYFGHLSFPQWKRFHSKHFSHHFVQFNIHKY